ncbi:hypothetical protein Ancab_034795 [Ancistrocladus abbreviatus]
MTVSNNFLAIGRGDKPLVFGVLQESDGGTERRNTALHAFYMSFGSHCFATVQGT